MSSTDKIILKSSDGESFEVEEAVALQFGIIRQMIEGMGVPAEGIPLPNVTGKVLSKVIEYCKIVADTDRDSSVDGDDLKAGDAEFVKVDSATLIDLTQAAHDLEIKSLRELTIQTVADMMPGKTPEETTKTYTIRNDFTPEEEEEVRRENQWAFD